MTVVRHFAHVSVSYPYAQRKVWNGRLSCEEGRHEKVEEMKNFRVDFVREGVSAEVREGATILDAQRAAGLVPNAPCGGQGTCGKCGVRVEGRFALACQTAVCRDMAVDTEPQTERSEAQILMQGSGRKVTLAPGALPECAGSPLLAAVDLGTTSLVAYLMDAQTGEELSVRSMLNPQRQYGADVVARCSCALENGAELLSGCVREAVNTLLRETALECGRSREDIVRVVMAGNTCMHHLFLEIPTDTLVVAPYEARVTEPVRRLAFACGIQAHPSAELWWLPNIGGFVGADTTACILACRMTEREKITLMVDIGTNGEMVLGDRRGLSACSTAAGPAFEGAKISCGMRGSKGAIDHVYLKDGQICWQVIGGGEPVGICGSGLLDAAACFLRLGIMDETGRMKDTYYFTPKVFVSQKDIRELQLAKAAIAAGIRLLCAHRGIGIGQIDTLLLAGAFGNYLNPDSACAIGLLPAVLRERIRAVGNAAGEGAQIAVLNRMEYERSADLARRVEFLELALDQDFQEIYVEEMEFPEWREGDGAE